jgi:hypothetical protein
LIIKFFEKTDDNKAIFKSYNKDYKDVTIPLKSIKAAYFVVKVIPNDPYSRINKT